MTSENRNIVFDYRALRLLMGIIAFSLPIIVTLISSSKLPSISASYYTESRDAFVGMLFVVCAFLWAYNGHTKTQAWASRIASIAALIVAVCPTYSNPGQMSIIPKIHGGAAVCLFIILAYFCLGPFRQKIKGQKGKKGRRSKVYCFCGWGMVGCMVLFGVAYLVLSDAKMESLRITYWVEAIALWLFGIAWIVAGKNLKFFVDEQEALRLFKR